VKILLTGGTGFVGRSLLEGLGTTHQIVAPPHRELDVGDSNAVDEAFRAGRFDVVLHAAAAGGERVLENVLRGFWNVARNAHRVGRVFYFGSGAEYGKHRDLVKVREEQIGAEVPRDDYGLAKLLCNDIARRSTNVTNLRLFGIYGPHEGYLFKFISNTIAKTLLGMDLVIRQDVIFDYLWIDDFVAIVRSLLERSALPADVNVTPTQSISLLELARIVTRLHGERSSIHVENSGLNYAYTGSNDRLRDLLPHLAFTPYPEAIRSLAAHYASRTDSLDRVALEQDRYRLSCRVRT
jgi:nucleoside-diphosphate-sugar epimerase